MENRTWKEIEAEKKRLKAEYGALYEGVSAALFRHDPMAINFETNTDEYEPEVGTILPRLKSCNSVDAVQQIVHEEFVKWFDSDTAGPAEVYRDVAQEIWQLWADHRSRLRNQEPG